MESIASIIEKEEVSRRNKLREHCNEQLTIAVKSGNFTSAIILIKTVFCITLKESKEIVEYVRAGATFNEAFDLLIK